MLDATLDNVAAWIADPQAIKPGNRMPTLWTADDPNRDTEARAIAAYLLSLGAPEAVAGNGKIVADSAGAGTAAGGN